MVANHGGSPSGRLVAVGGRFSPDRVVGRCMLLLETARDRGALAFRFVGGAEVFRLVEPVLLTVFLPEVFCCILLNPRLPGRLSGEGVEPSCSTLIGSLALRLREDRSSSSVAARLRELRESRPMAPDMGTGLIVETGIREALFPRLGWL